MSAMLQCNSLYHCKQLAASNMNVLRCMLRHACVRLCVPVCVLCVCVNVHLELNGSPPILEQIIKKGGVPKPRFISGYLSFRRYQHWLLWLHWVCEYMCIACVFLAATQQSKSLALGTEIAFYYRNTNNVKPCEEWYQFWPADDVRCISKSKETRHVIDRKFSIFFYIFIHDCLFLLINTYVCITLLQARWWSLHYVQMICQKTKTEINCLIQNNFITKGEKHYKYRILVSQGMERIECSLPLNLFDFSIGDARPMLSLSLSLCFVMKMTVHYYIFIAVCGVSKRGSRKDALIFQRIHVYLIRSNYKYKHKSNNQWYWGC